MRKWNIISLLLVSVLILGTTIQLPADDYSNFQGRAISLKVLQQQARDFQNKGSMPTTLYYLCGITTIHGYLVDEANKDIILIGSVDKKKPPLYLDDFVIALRNAWMKYTELKGNTNYYSNPGCSIDPDPVVMGKLDEIAKQINESSSIDQTEKGLRQWDNVCNSPQKVRVMGIPFNSHFASVMVKADYDMKKIADGSDELNLLWFSTLSDLQLDEAKKQHIHGRPSSSPNGSMNRFWFCPGEYRFLEDDGAVMIETCKVKLLTEEEHLTSKGDISGTGRPNPVAQKFVNDFSSFYSEVAAQRPIYQELENLFRFVALAKAMKMKTPHEKVGLSLDYLLEQYPVSTQKVETFLQGRSNISRYKRQRESAQGSQVLQLWLPSCGGVSMDIELTPQQFERDNSNSLINLKENTINGNITHEQLFWDSVKNFPQDYIPKKSDYYIIIVLDPDAVTNLGHIALLLGGENMGYVYYSKAVAGNSKVKFYSYLIWFKFDETRYSEGYKMPISSSQYSAMKGEADSLINSKYNLFINNCNHFVIKVLTKGNLYPGETNIIPIIQFRRIKGKNPGETVW